MSLCIFRLPNTGSQCCFNAKYNNYCSIHCNNHNNIYEDHFKLNSYDESFTSTSKKKEINEEFDIDL